MFPWTRRDTSPEPCLSSPGFEHPWLHPSRIRVGASFVTQKRQNQMSRSSLDSVRLELYVHFRMYATLLDSLSSQNKMRLNNSPRFHDTT